ncbi:MAG: hypothetical protein ACJATA_000429 [Sphingobacteriales bacterium]
MCILTLALNVNPHFPLILIGNRDEFLNRPADPLSNWNNVGIIAGKDKSAGGTWLGVSSENSRWAIITNYRDPLNINLEAPTRGDLIPNYLKSNLSAEEHIAELKATLKSFNGFNLILGEGLNAWFVSNHEERIEKLDPGFYGLSNDTLNTQWPKVTFLTSHFKEEVKNASKINKEHLFELLQNNSAAADKDLPNTGVGIDWERKLSSVFIKTENYGTRCSSVLVLDDKNKLEFTERTYPISKQESFYTTINIPHFIK